MEEKDIVKKHYSEVAVAGQSEKVAHELSLKVGYTEEDLKAIPTEAKLGLGCGNSVSYANLKEGEQLIDLGCGAGMDLFLAASKVGKTGKAVGVDFSPDMIERGRLLIEKYEYTNVEMVASSIDKMPFETGTFDVAISNCVLNLLPDKALAFKEIFRVLKPGGRFVVADIVLKKALPEVLMWNLASIVGCLGRAVDNETYMQHLIGAGFVDSKIENQEKDLNLVFEKACIGDEGEEGAGCCACACACAGKGEGDEEQEKKRFDKLDVATMKKHDVNEYATSSKVTATKPF